MTGNPTCHAKLDQRTPEATDQPAASKATGTPTPAADGGPPPSSEPPVTLGVPVIGDGPGLWRIARDSGPLDLNSPYSYLLWCRDFAHTSVAARAAPADGRPGDDPGPLVGFVTGYIRPEAPDTVVVWQIAVDSSQRGRGLARRMLHHLADRLAPAGVGFLEATITPGNEPSTRLFSGFARDVGAPVCRQTLFGAELFPPGHEPEVLFRIGPFPVHPSRDDAVGGGYGT